MTHLNNWIFNFMLYSLEYSGTKDTAKYLDDNKLNFSSDVGYFPGGHKSIKELIRYISRNYLESVDANKISKELLVKSGVLYKNKDSLYYSPLEERIIFPVRNKCDSIYKFKGIVFRENDERAKEYITKDLNNEK